MNALPIAEFRALGTSARVSVTDPQYLDHACSLLQDEVSAIDKACSRFRADSEIVTISRAGGKQITISPLLTAAIGVALRAARVTDGAVDCTVGSALCALGYDVDFSAIATVDRAATVIVRPIAGWRTIELEADHHTVRVPDGVILDLGATAKAFAADRAAAAISDAYHCGAIVNLGGDIAIAGNSPQDGWAIRVTDDSSSGIDAPGQTIVLRNGGLATSSVTVRRWTSGGVERHHIVDPRTALPVRGELRTVSVTAATCVDANIAATAAIVWGRSAFDWVIRHNVPTRAVESNGTVHHLAGWPPEGESA